MTDYPLTTAADLRYHLYCARKAANGALSTLDYALEQDDAAQAEYVAQWIESVLADLRQATASAHHAAEAANQIKGA